MINRLIATALVCECIFILPLIQNVQRQQDGRINTATVLEDFSNDGVGRYRLIEAYIDFQTVTYTMMGRWRED